MSIFLIFFKKFVEHPLFVFYQIADFTTTQEIHFPTNFQCFRRNKKG
ncbi:MAG: hypothetical protein UX72_C0011G0030 [Parcubacteria group bacterium GW2011_GWA2_47_10]|nr:MAG: hypothetical protein UX72_C0011G0030 [Parcubacteria group bacterium GW2011_GWA2_47_10]